MIVFAYNPDVTNLEKSFLQSAVSTGAVTLKIKNSNAFANTRRVLVGSPGRERTEMVTQSAKTNTSLTVGATKFSHDPDDTVYALVADQIRYYRSTTGINGTYSVLGTIDVDWNNPKNQTGYDDANALETYFYKITYYDSVADDETDFSPPIQASGYPDNSVGETLLQVVAEVNDKNFLIFDITEWLGIMNNISKDLYKQAKRPYRFLKRNEALDVEADDDSVLFPADFWKVNYIEVNQYNPGGNPLIFRPKDFSNPTTVRFRQSQNVNPSDYVNGVALDDEAMSLLFYPRARTERLSAFNFHYYKKFTKFADLGDLLETPDNLVYQYGMKRAYYLRKSDDDNKYMTQYNEYDKMYQTEIRMLQREKNIDAGAPHSMGPDNKRYPQFGIARYRQ